MKKTRGAHIEVTWKYSISRKTSQQNQILSSKQEKWKRVSFFLLFLIILLCMLVFFVWLIRIRFFLAVPMSFWRFVLIILATNKTTLTDTLCYFFVSWIFRQYLMSHQQWMRLLMIHVFVIFSSREIQIMRKVIYTGSCLVSVCRVVEHTTQHMRMIKISSVKPHFISENRQQ